MSDPADAPAPLSGIRVLDLGRGPAAGLASMVLADFGADVLVVEPPGGDPQRALASAPMWLRGKRSCQLDLSTDSGRAALAELNQDADVVLFGGGPARARALGVAPEVLRAQNPALVYCSVSGWGQHGPYADWPGIEALVAAKSGRMLAFAGQKPRAGPAYAAVQVATHAASQGAVHGIIAALLARASHGRGAHVQTSLLQGLLPYDLMSLMLTQLIRREPERFGNLPVIGGGMPTLNYHPVMAGDGRWLQCGNLLEHLFYAFLDATDLIGELLADERFAQDAEGWSAEATEFARDRILERLQERSADEWMDIFRAQGNVAIEPYLTTQQALYQLDLVANGDVVEHQHPRLGTVRQVGVIAELTATPGSAAQPAPEPGAHAPGWLPRAVKPMVAGDTDGHLPQGQPLAGITILELGTIIATPLGTSMLADLGARVIKVEPIGGDPFREMGVGPTVGLMAAKTNAGKQSISIDLKTDAGRSLVRQLAARADAVVHNYRPGVPERIGIGYEQLKAQRPDIVWVSANGYGRHAPGANRPSAHPVPGAAMGGAIHQAGTGMPASDDRSLPALREVARQLMRANEANPDPNTSVLIASATLLALLAQRRFGIGQQVFVNMLTANAYANWDDFLAWDGKPERAPVDADILGLGALYRLYECGDGWVFVAVTGEDGFANLCRVLDATDMLADARFADHQARARHDAALSAALAARFAAGSAADFEARLIAVGVGCVRADGASVGEFYTTDAHAAANNLAPRVRHGLFGELARHGALTTVDAGMPAYAAGVLAGADTDRLLTELGCSGADIEALVASGVVARAADA